MEKYGAGDSYIMYDVLEDDTLILERLKSEINFREVMHRGGKIPRLFAVQCIIENNREPIYRHPIDEEVKSEEMSETVLSIKDRIESLLGREHFFNHVLIQLYRDGKDNISEHSDKMLDISRGSVIVNFSLGRERVMTLRSKEMMMSLEDKRCISSVGRDIQRVYLRNNSLFVMGSETNRLYTHGIKSDSGISEERVSLTFRSVATFRDLRTGELVGQGSGWNDNERILYAFREENRTVKTWDEIYKKD